MTKRRIKNMTDENRKEIIYLDNIELTSVLSQFGEGLPTSKTASQKNGHSEEGISSSTGGVKGDVSVPLVASASVNGSVTDTNKSSDTNSVGESLNIDFLDYQLERLVNKYSSSIVDANKNTVSEGDLISYTENFRLTSPSSINNLELKNILDVFETFGMAGNRNPTSKEEKRLAIIEKANTKKTFKSVMTLGQMLGSILPETTLLTMNGATSFMENSNLRISTGQLGLLANTKRKITVIGILESRMAGSYNLNDNISDKTIFNIVGALPTVLLSTFLTASKDIKIDDMLIKPIAVYFE